MIFDRQPHCFSTLFALLLLAVPAAAQVQVHDTLSTVEPLTGAVRAPYGYVATPAPQELSAVSGDVAPELLSDVASFEADAGGSWKYWVDRRSGSLALAEGSGMPWMPGDGNGLDPATNLGSGPGGSFTAADVESMARAFVSSYPALVGVSNVDLQVIPGATVNLGEAGQYWQVAFRQTISNIPVAHSWVVFRVSHGNLVQFGANRVTRVAPAMSAAPTLTAEQARTALGVHVGGLDAGDVFSEDGVLEWNLMGSDNALADAVGQGWSAALTYRFTFQRAGSMYSWQALVDAHSGDVVRFVDNNDYSVVLSGVYASANCADPTNCVPGSNSEIAVTLPDVDLTFTGGTCTGDECFSSSAGGFTYPPGAVSASTLLHGKRLMTTDACGPINASGAAPGNIDLGTTPADGTGTNTDCVVATQESPGAAGPFVPGGAGDTHAARNMYYHLNLINQKSRFYLPNNLWLQGSDGPRDPALLNTNLPPACNAFWQPGTGSLNFQRVTTALNCNNTGELPQVALHEFGHGLDTNDGTGSAPESATGEAMGDTFALLESQASCIGVGFRLPDGTDWGASAGYGDATTGSNSYLCSGVRDIDYTNFCTQGIGTSCAAALVDPDCPAGSRSGPTPPFLPDLADDIGTAAAWNTMIHTPADAPPGAADGKCNFYDCGGPETLGCAGPLNHGCHCESLIAGQANFDFAKRLIENRFAGSAYESPQTGTEVSGWQYVDRIWYLTRDIAVSAYSATGTFPAGTTNGCTATDWFPTYRFIDDNDGNLANGTPNAAELFDAFDLHAMACGAVGDPSNQNAGCTAPVAAPTISLPGPSCTQTPVQVQWDSVPGATQFRVLRNTLGCGFGFTPVTELTAAQTFYEDGDVAPGASFFYRVQSVGENLSCYGGTSNCVEVVPTECSATAAGAPTNPAAGPTANDNELLVSWDDAGALAYSVQRKTGDCSSTEPWVTVGTSSTTSFVDTGLLGTQDYAYQILSSDDDCTSCTSAPSTCVAAAPTGLCSPFDPICLPEAFNDSATAGVGGATSINVLVNDIDPNGDALNLIAADAVTAQGGSAVVNDNGTPADPTDDFVDYTPPSGLAIPVIDTFDYTINDGLFEDTATVTVNYTPSCLQLTSNTFFDDMESGGDASWSFATPTNSQGDLNWQVLNDPLAQSGDFSFVTGAVNKPGVKDDRLISGPIRPSEFTRMVFWQRFFFAVGSTGSIDGGVLEVCDTSTNCSNEANWQDIEDAGGSFLAGGYRGLMRTNGNPGTIPGRRAWSDQSENGVNANTRTVVDLTPFAGQEIQVRWRNTGDNTVLIGGTTTDWYVDDILIPKQFELPACAPIAVDDTETTAADTAVDVFVLDNDLEPDGDVLLLSSVQSPTDQNGTAVIHDNATPGDASDDYVVFTPDTGFNGDDTFTYEVCDGSANCESATVTVTVGGGPTGCTATIPLFSDGFDTGDASAWDFARNPQGDMSFADLGLDGPFGMSIHIDHRVDRKQREHYVAASHAATDNYCWSFLFDPSSISVPTGRFVRIWGARADNGRRLLVMAIRNIGGTLHVATQVYKDGGAAEAVGFAPLPAGPVLLGGDWSNTGAGGRLALYIDGVEVDAKTGISGVSRRLTTPGMGNLGQLTRGTLGDLHFDAFSGGAN